MSDLGENSRNGLLNPSPIDALIDLKVGCGLRRPIPVGYLVRLDLRPVTDLRITVLPQRWPTCGSDIKSYAHFGG